MSGSYYVTKHEKGVGLGKTEKKMGVGLRKDNGLGRQVEEKEEFATNKMLKAKKNTMKRSYSRLAENHNGSRGGRRRPAMREERKNVHKRGVEKSFAFLTPTGGKGEENLEFRRHEGTSGC